MIFLDFSRFSTQNRGQTKYDINRDAEVEATLDPMAIGCSMGLDSEEVSLVSEVIMAAKIRAEACSMVGALDPMEGSLDTLCLFLRGQSTGEVVC